MAVRLTVTRVSVMKKPRLSGAFCFWGEGGVGVAFGGCGNLCIGEGCNALPVGAGGLLAQCSQGKPGGGLIRLFLHSSSFREHWRAVRK